MNQAASFFVAGDFLPGSPELAPRGSHAVGVQTLGTGTAGRPLVLEIWYPAARLARSRGGPGAGPTALTWYDDVFAGADGAGRPRQLRLAGRARRDAPAQRGPGNSPWPLVLVSHGHPGNRYLMTFLTEHLASRGYVVAALQHPDPPGRAGEPAVAASLIQRSADQSAALDHLETIANTPGFWQGLYDPGMVGLLGFSMGGCGALRTLGAGFSQTVLQLGGPQAASLADGPDHVADRRVAAAILCAPWGGALQLWDQASLTGIKVPSLWIAGSQDDVSGYQAIRGLYEGARASRRWLLTVQNARHNLATNPPPGSISDPEDWQHWGDPVWDTRRLNNIVQHFATAFLDHSLKGSVPARRWLDVAVTRAEDGIWDMDADGHPGPAHTHWPGFLPRCALGLSLEHGEPSGT